MPAKTNVGGEFAEQILADLIEKGYSGNELSEVRPAVEAILAEAEKAAISETEYVTYEEVFGVEDEG